MAYKTLVVDDEPLAREVIESYLSQMGDFELVASCKNAIEANEVLNRENIDLMFLDINMPQVSGIEFLESLKNPPSIIFTTAHSEHAVKAYELDVIDYLMKPVPLDRFMKATNKFIERQGPIQDSEEDFFFVKADKKLVKVHFDEILYIEGLKDYVIIRKDIKRIITLQTMKSLEQKLPSQIFMRIHRSYIVNISKIKAVVGNSVEIIEKGQTKHLPVGKNYKDDLHQIINARRL